MKNFTLSLTTKTLTITKAFEDAVATGKGDEYETYKRLMEDIPDLKVIRKTHASPRKYVNKQGEQFNCNQFKNLTFKNMEGFINGLSNSEEIFEAYNFLKKCGSLPQTSRYTAVRKWFVAQFPEFRKNPLFYLYNEVKVVDIAPFIEEEQNRTEKQSAEDTEKAS